MKLCFIVFCMFFIAAVLCSLVSSFNPHLALLLWSQQGLKQMIHNMSFVIECGPHACGLNLLPRLLPRTQVSEYINMILKAFGPHRGLQNNSARCGLKDEITSTI